MSSKYTPSGKFSPLGIAWFLLACATAYPLAGLAYAYALWYCPFVYFNVVLTLLGGCVGVTGLNNLIARLGKIRNPKVSAATGALGALTFLYCHWVVWTDLAINAHGGTTIPTGSAGAIVVSNIQADHIAALALSPQLLGRIILDIDRTGAWSILGFTVSGIPLLLVWAVEAMAVVGCASLVLIQVHKPFCEASDRWFEATPLEGCYEFVAAKEEFLQALSQGDFRGLVGLERIDGSTQDHSRITLYTSAGSEAAYVAIANRALKLDKHGKIDFSNDEICACEYVDEATRRHLKGTP